MTILQTKSFLTIDDIFSSNYAWTPRFNGLVCSNVISGNNIADIYDDQTILNTGIELIFQDHNTSRTYSLNFALNNIDTSTITPVLLSKNTLRPYLVGTEQYAIAIVADSSLESAKLQVNNNLRGTCFEEDEKVFVRIINDQESLFLDDDKKTFWQSAAEMKTPQRIHDFS